MKETEIKYKTDILRYSTKKNSWCKCGDCDLLQNLKFANREFYLTYKKGYYFVCTEKGRDIASVYRIREGEGSGRVLPGEAVSEFRKGYLKNGITPEMLDLFLENPEEYSAKYKKPAR